MPKPAMPIDRGAASLLGLDAVVIDTETTGLDPYQGHRLVEVGCVELLNRMPTGNIFHYYVHPEREIPEEAFRVHGISLLEERFTPDVEYKDLPETAFPHSLGVHSGPPERVEIDFQPTVAEYVRARQWHPSQRVSELAGGGVRVTLDVSTDPSLHGWILSFGPVARVASPESLVREIARQIEETRALYL